MNVGDIKGDHRRSIEDLVGRSLDEDARVYIMVYKAGVVPDADTRREAREGLRQTFAKTKAYAAEHGITDDEADAAVDEAMEHVRGRHS
jgi:hypothetical protein